jgi:hypothetical protein
MVAATMVIKSGVTIRPGVTVSGVLQTGGNGGGSGSYTAVQAFANTGSNAVHIDVSYPWASTVPVGATIVADGIGTFTVIAVLAPNDQGNTSGNWFFVVDPTNASFPGGIPLAFTW